ncbi:MAG: hypothetical protein AABZ64_03140, partial [Nitrospinota bacterium]
MRRRWSRVLSLALAAALAGCQAPQFLTKIRSLASGSEVTLVPLAQLDPSLYRAHIFYAEYLDETAATTERVAVLAEEAQDTLRLILSTTRYLSGETGTGRLPELAQRFAPLRLHVIQAGDGRRLGYAFLPPGKTLRL